MAVCGDATSVRSRNFSRILLGDVSVPGSQLTPMRVYAILDEQINGSLASSSFAEHFGANLPKRRYSITTCGAEKQELPWREWGFIATASSYRVQQHPTEKDGDPSS